MHCFERLACVISGNAFCFDIVKKVLDEVHLGDIEGAFLILLLILNSQRWLHLFEGVTGNLRMLVPKTSSPSSGLA